MGSLGSGVAALATYGYASRIETQQLQLRRATVPLKKLGSSLDGLKIVLMADFHLYPNTQIELIERAVAMANELRPDLIALCGDYVLGTADSIFELAPVLGRLNARHGIFSILGNHDHWKGEKRVRAGLEASGLTVLQNQGITLTIGRDLLFLAGIDDGWAGRQDLLKGLQNHSSDLPTLLLMHEPDFADEFSADGRISLQLSGHSHGGQVRFPFIGSPFLPPYGRKSQRHADQMSHKKISSDCPTCCSRVDPRGGRVEDHKEKQCRQHYFQSEGCSNREKRRHIVGAQPMSGQRVLRYSGRGIARDPIENSQQNQTGKDCSHNLRAHVEHGLAGFNFTSSHHGDRQCWIYMASWQLPSPLVLHFWFWYMPSGPFQAAI